MFAFMVKNIIIIISLGLIFMPTQVFALSAEQMLETLFPGSQQKQTQQVPPVNNLQDIMTIKQPQAPTVLTPTINTPQSQSLPLFTPQGSVMQSTMKNNKANNKVKNFIPLAPMPHANFLNEHKAVTQQNKQSPEESKTQSKKSTPNLSLKDFLLKSIQNSLTGTNELIPPVGLTP